MVENAVDIRQNNLISEGIFAQDIGHFIVSIIEHKRDESLYLFAFIVFHRTCSKFILSQRRRQNSCIGPKETIHIICKTIIYFFF